MLLEVNAKALRGGVSSSYVKDAFRRAAVELPEGTGAFTVLQRGAGTEKPRVGNHFQIRLKSELRLSDSLMLPLLCSDDGDRCVTLFHREQNTSARSQHGLMRFVPRA